ncbi:MAG: hypothetical protein FWG71_00900 [Synergistaceae bacterium]|nr:hypothetical protein [Synergistaceae bacterium]
MAGILMLGALTAYSTEEAVAALATDIVGRVAISSFSEMIDALEFPPILDEEEKLWVLSTPDGEASFWWRSEANLHRHMLDVQICFEAEPFVNAGLDLDKLPEEMKGMLEAGRLMMGKQLSQGSLVYAGEITPLSSFEQIVRLDRDSIGYHAAADHYKITVAGGLSDGWIFMWAKDMSTNAGDIVFALEPTILIGAGVDPDKVEGWTFRKVPMMDERGRNFEVDKFVKAFDLR